MAAAVPGLKRWYRREGWLLLVRLRIEPAGRKRELAAVVEIREGERLGQRRTKGDHRRVGGFLAEESHGVDKMVMVGGLGETREGREVQGRKERKGSRRSKGCELNRGLRRRDIALFQLLLEI